MIFCESKYIINSSKYKISITQLKLNLDIINTNSTMFGRFMKIATIGTIGAVGTCILIPN